jgi:HEAT repeat protein
MISRSLDDLVQDLGVRHRSKAARRELMRRGPEATRALQRGLSDSNPAVRVGCCVVLDHHLDALTIPDLLANVAHEDAQVRRWAMHALACDRCKEGECRPGENDTVPLAMRMLTDDVDYQVRTAAVRALGPSAHTRDDVVHALQRAHAQDPHPLVRKVAGWFIPGGPIHRRTQPRADRVRARSRAR